MKTFSFRLGDLDGNAHDIHRTSDVYMSVIRKCIRSGSDEDSLVSSGRLGFQTHASKEKETIARAAATLPTSRHGKTAMTACHPTLRVIYSETSPTSREENSLMFAGRVMVLEL